MNWEALIRDYIRSKRIKGRKESTLYNYEKNLRYLLLSKGILDYDRDFFLSFWEHLRKDPSVGDWRFTHLVSDLKRFIKWAKKRVDLPNWVIVEVDDLEPIPKSKIREKHELYAFTSEQEQKLLDSCKNKTERFLWWLALNTGLRRNELMNLRRSDITPKGVLVRAEISKNGKSRYIPFTSDQEKIVNDYLRYRDLIDAESDFLFLNRKKKQLRLDQNSGTKMLERLSKACGFRVAFHLARYTFAVKTLQLTDNIWIVMKLLGHSNTEVTERYLRIRPEDEPEIIRRKLEEAKRRKRE